MKVKFSSILKILIMVVLAIAAPCIIYVFMITSEINNKVSKHVSVEVQNEKISTLEEYSGINHDDFKLFNTFTKFPITLEDNVIHNSILSSDLKFSSLIVNDCDRLQCIQEKVKFSEIPSSIWRALVGIEDSRFLEHKGVDLISILRAIVIDLKAMKLVQGGSTLTQQLVKNIFLTNEKSFQRKFKEVFYALVLESLYSKEEILGLYLNESFWGSIGNIYIRGVSAASRIYFGKEMKNLSEYEAAILIGMLKGPNFYHPLRRQERLIDRTKVVLKRLREINFFAKDISKDWVSAQWYEWKQQLGKLDTDQRLKNMYTTLSSSENSRTYEYFVFRQGVSKVLKDLGSKLKGKDIAVKLLKTQRGCSGNCDEFKYYSKIERSLDSAIDLERHQIGSILKPVIYSEFLNMGKKLDDYVSTLPITLKLLSGDWTPRDSRSIEEEITLKQALQKSKNIPLIRLANEVGFDNLEAKLLNIIPRLQLPLAQYPSQLLGAVELSLREITNIYNDFINKLCRDNNELIEVLTDASETTLSRQANKLIKSTRIFGKTGTTNGGQDGWFIADDGQSFYVIWMGIESERQVGGALLYGAGSSFKIFEYYIKNRGKQIPEFFCKTKD